MPFRCFVLGPSVFPDPLAPSDSFCASLRLSFGRIQFVEELPDAELQWIEECGHVPHLEQPDETASTIRNFLTSDRVIAATASAARSSKRRKSSSVKSILDGGGTSLQPLVIGGGFFGVVSGAYLLEEVIRNFLLYLAAS